MDEVANEAEPRIAGVRDRREANRKKENGRLSARFR